MILKSVDGAWSIVGKDIGRGVHPEQVSLSANEAGPDTCSFLLRRRGNVPWPDLQAFNQAEVWVDGSPVWGGRVWEAPITGDQVAVQGRGWQYHLDDDMLHRFYVRTRLADFRDQRTFVTAHLPAYQVNGEVTGTGGAIQLRWARGSNAVGHDRLGTTMDFGENANGPKRVVVTYETSNNTTDVFLYARSHDDESEWDSDLAGDISDAWTGQLLTSLGASGTTAGTFATRRRYLTIFMFRDNAATGSFGADVWVRLNGVQVFASTSYESGNASILKADTVIKDVLASGAVPLLSDDTTLITAGSVNIPDFAPDGYQTPRQLVEAANAYEGNLAGVNAQRQLFSRERDTTATIEAGATGFQFQDATTNTGGELYNKVIVQGTAPDGTPISEARTASSSLLTRQGFTRTATLNVTAAVTASAAQTLGDVWLGEYSTPKFKGTATFTGPGSVRTIGGATLHPSQLLHYGGRLLRVPVVDPATGGWTRDCLIKSVTYDHDSETATVELDNERGNFQTLLNRYGVNVNQALTRVG